MSWRLRQKAPDPGRRRAGRGAVTLIATMFLLSGVLRFSDAILPSLAQATPVAGDAAQTAAAPDNCDMGPAALAAALSLREARVLARETALGDHEAALALADAALQGRLEALEAAETKLRGTIAMADGAAEADVARLIAVYETMKPKDAAALFEAMDANFAAGFLGRMRPDAAGAVLAGMSAEKAYALSVILAGRNAGAPKG